MSKLPSKNLKWIRNAIIAAEMMMLFIIWSFIPEIIKNNPIVHVGNGKYGPRVGFLLLTLLPLLGLIAHGGSNWDNEEIHTDDAREKARIEVERKTETFKKQILLSIALFILAFFVIIVAIISG